MTDLKSDNHRKKEPLNDPYSLHDPGLHSYLMITDKIFKIFLVLSLLAGIQLIVFRSFSGLVDFRGYDVL